jgi:hypothetical protein
MEKKEVHYFGVVGGYCSCCTIDMRVVCVSARDREHLRERLMTERGILTAILTSGAASARCPDSKDTGDCKCPERLSFVKDFEMEEEFISFEGDVLDYKPFADYYRDHDILEDLESEVDDSAEGFYALYFGAGEEAYRNMCFRYGDDATDKMLLGKYRGDDEDNESHVEHAVYKF